MTIMAILNELLGDQLIQHTADENGQNTKYISTNELAGKTVGLYFS